MFKYLYFSDALLNKAINGLSPKITLMLGLSQLSRLNAHCLPIDGRYNGKQQHFIPLQ